MPFWTDVFSEPKRAHRFLLELPNLASPTGDAMFTYQKYLAKSVTKPAYTVGTATHKFLGNSYYYPGSVEWNEISAVIVNSIKPDGNALLINALTGMGYLFPNTQEEIFTAGQLPGTVNKAMAQQALGLVSIQELNGEGGLVGTWKLWNAWITSATFGDLNYDSDTDMLNITVGMRYDWAEYTTGDAAQFAEST